MLNFNLRFFALEADRVVQYHHVTPLLVTCVGWNYVMVMGRGWCGSWVNCVMGHGGWLISISDSVRLQFRSDAAYDQFPEGARPRTVVIQTDRNSTSGRRQTDTHWNQRPVDARLASLQPPSCRTSGNRFTSGSWPEVDERAEIAPIGRKHDDPLISGIADDDVAEAVAAQVHRTI